MWQLININERSQDTRVGWRIEIEATICSRCCCCPAKAAHNHTHSHTHVYTYECEHNNRSICRRSTHALACVGQTLGQGIIPKIDLNTTISDLRWRSSMDYLRWPVLFPALGCFALADLFNLVSNLRSLTFAAIRLGGSLGQATWTGCGQIDDTVLRRGEWQFFINEGAGRGWCYMCVGSTSH